ncbi:hypothetical protein, partial [Escherichia coli]|uniref:hypothetical protein n=1 Tax=Escherichia coli TaxID=562 RepID=UPI001BDBA0C0
VPAYGPQNDVTLKMPAFEWVHVQLHQQKGMISLSPPTICNSATLFTRSNSFFNKADFQITLPETTVFPVSVHGGGKEKI